MNESNEQTPVSQSNNILQERVETPTLITQAMGTYLQETEKYKSPENPETQEIFKKYLSIIQELSEFVDMKAITQNQSDEILAGLLTKGELNSLKDDLTGLVSENGFNLFLNKIISHSERHKEDFAVAYLDLKGFKTVNDEHGHKRGDDILKMVGNFLSGLVREEDLVAHLHGDEFAIIFRNIKEQDLDDLRKKLSTDTLTYQLPMQIRNEMLNSGNDPRNAIVSARIGFSTYRENDTVETMKERADIDMIKGRNEERHHDR
jgi:diguanylate cyclase (GGDEF)-like protein